MSACYLHHAQYRITMAAIDPTEAPQPDEEGNLPAVPRATLRLVRQRYPDLHDELDDEYLEALMGGDDEDDEDDSEDEESNGGPSDPAKSKKAKAEAALKKLMEAAQEESDSDEEMDDDAAKPNGTKASKKGKKGKEPAVSSDDDDDESIDSDAIDLEEFVICTLDTERVSILDSTTTPQTHADPTPPCRTTSSPSTLPLVPMRRSSSA